MSGTPPGRETAAVLGGTFDPVHLGHLGIAEGVRGAFGLARTILVPCYRPPHKDDRAVSSAADRLSMLRLAVLGNEHLSVSSVEIDRGGTSYTIETLDHFRDAERIDPLFVLGVDALAELPTWREFQRLTLEYDLVVVDRPGGSLAGAMRLLDPETARRVVAAPSRAPGGGTVSVPEPGRGGRIFHLPLPLLDLSSRQIRARVAARLPIDGLVPPAVGRYIQERSLYC